MEHDEETQRREGLERQRREAAENQPGCAVMLLWVLISFVVTAATWMVLYPIWRVFQETGPPAAVTVVEYTVGLGVIAWGWIGLYLLGRRRWSWPLRLFWLYGACLCPWVMFTWGFHKIAGIEMQ